MKEYPIDTILVMTVERAKERHDSLLGALMQPLCGVPPDLIKFCLCADAKDYGSDMAKVAFAAVSDGFPWVEEYAIGSNTEFVQQTAASTAQVWAYAKMLRYIVETEQTGLIIWDDKSLAIPFVVFCDILSILANSTKAFYMWQLMVRGHPDEVALKEFDLSERIARSGLLFSAMFRGHILHPSFFLEEGIKGYDETIVFSPAGAKWMLEQLASASEFHSFLDHFICHELPGRALEASKGGYGIYSPIEFGYQFARVYREMGTLTDWAHKGSVHYEESIKRTDIQYLHL